MGRHGFAPITANVDPAILFLTDAGIEIVHIKGFSGFCGESRPRVGRRGVDRIITRKDQRPAVVPILSGEVEGSGESIALGRVVAVVLVGRDGVQSEPVVGRGIDRQGVVVPHQDSLSVTTVENLPREGAVPSPQRLRILNGEVGVESRRDPVRRAADERTLGIRGIDRVIQSPWRELSFLIPVALPRIPDSAVQPRSSLDSREVGLRKELFPTLVGPRLSGWPAFDRWCFEGALQEGFHDGLPRVQVPGVGELRRELGEAVQAEEGVERRPIGEAGRTGGQRQGLLVLRRPFHLFHAELLEEEHLLLELLGSEKRARDAPGGDLAPFTRQGFGVRLGVLVSARELLGERLQEGIRSVFIDPGTCLLGRIDRLGRPGRCLPLGHLTRRHRDGEDPRE